MNHEAIWRIIDHIAERQNISVSALAKRAGLNATTFNKSKRFSGEGQERWPSTRSLSKVLTISNLSWQDLPSLIQ